MRRLALLLALTVGLPVAALATGALSADAASRGRIDAEFIARVHERHGHSQFRGGEGTPGHTWLAYRREARRLRAYLYQVRLAEQRAALVRRWQGVANCEAGGNWRANTGNGHYGGLQFNLRTWQAYGGSGYPHHQAAWTQATVADRVRRDTGLGAWPHCGYRYG
jgi:hypothetical protein